jgi:flagellar hook-associated protein 2
MSSPVFSGNSRFSNDFRSIVDRSVAIAQLPQRQLENQRGQFDAKGRAVDSISSRIGSFRSSLDGLKRALVANPNTAAATTPGIADLAVTAVASPASYSLNVISLGSPSSSWSRGDLPTVSNPSTEGISTGSSLTLRVNGANTTINAADNSLSSLANALNSASETTGVKASIVNVGGAGSANYRLVLQSNRLGSDSISLLEGATTLSDTVSTGSPAQYQVAGLPVTIESYSRTVEIAPGLSATLKQTGSTNVNVTRGSAQIDGAVNSFVQTFNGVLEELDKQRGASAGALAGDSLVTTIGGVLREITGYSEGSDSLVSKGLRYEQSGKLAFDPTAGGTSPEETARRNEFLNRFLERADALLDGVDDANDGALSNSKKTIGESISQNDARIRDIEIRVDALRDSLNARLSAADALIASLEQQVQYMNSLTEATRAQSR